jgi:nicotinamide mononucleotide transporter
VTSPLEIAAVLFTLANVWLAVKQNIWTWPAGIISVILYGVVFYQSRFYSNAALQVVYLALSIHGWYEWLHGGAGKSELRVSRTTRRQGIGCTIATIVLAIAIFGLLRLTTDAAFPFWDALTTAISLVAQWMLNEKLLENWLGWLFVDIIYVPMFALGGRVLTAGLYAVFCVMAWRGYVEWKRSLVQSASV